MTNVARNIGLWSTSWMVAWAVVCLCALADGVSMACPWIPLEEMEVAGHPNRDNLTSRTCCVWGNTVVPEHPHRARPFHSQTVQTQASPFHLSRGVIRSITLFFGWDICSSLSSSCWCVDGLFCRCTAPIQSSVTGTGTPDVVVSLPQGS